MEWEAAASNLVKAEMKRHRCTYEQLCRKLEALGVHETVGSIKGKLNRGTFTAVFLMQVIKALDIHTLQFDILYKE